ncbi:arylamine N-acetyltransferase family protein [Caballeronia sp.]|uniref:arylamine N-acetyltransferase family protein n=1 Tax=Caballeronia sp. TaxID=1931223 RepID=UPI003C6471CC
MIQTLSPAQLTGYFGRIGYTGTRTATSDTLHALHRLHPQVIPFANVDSLLGQTPSLDLDAVFNKLVDARRGGYCYEHNLLFRAVLDTLGFETTGLAARVLWNNDLVMPPRTHMMLLVETREETWLADIGFGSMTLSAPLAFEPGREQSTPHEPFRIDLIDRGDYMLRVKLGGVWKPIYRFDLEPQFPADYVVSNHFVSTFPASIFLNHLVVARLAAGARHTLLDRTLTTRGVAETQRQLATTAEVRDVLRDVFGLALPESGGAFDTVLERLGH